MINWLSPIRNVANGLPAYGYSCTAVSAKNKEYRALAKGACKAIEDVHGNSFDYGPICRTVYQASDGVDYVADVLKAAYSVTAELRDEGGTSSYCQRHRLCPYVRRCLLVPVFVIQGEVKFGMRLPAWVEGEVAGPYVRAP
jgi:hypothetical protein